MEFNEALQILHDNGFLLEDTIDENKKCTYDFNGINFKDKAQLAFHTENGAINNIVVKYIKNLTYEGDVS